MKPLVSIMTPTFNEEGNVDLLYERIRAVMAGLPDYDYEHLFIDNASSDATVPKVKALCAKDPRVKLIVNVRNFGPVRSPYHGMLAGRGDVVVCMASDLQDPPELIPDFLAKWREGFPVVLGVKTSSQEALPMYLLRGLYYRLVSGMADVQLVRQTTGFGLYARQVVDELRAIDDPFPYVRGLVSELGFPTATIAYHQPGRAWGVTSYNLYRLYDVAMLGITSHSKVPLRLASMVGFVVAGASLAVAAAYLVAKLVLWNYFPNIGQAPTVIGLFFFGGVQLIFTGILGEYIGAIHTRVMRRPLVVERERVNFDRGQEARVAATPSRETEEIV